ncbi:MAG: hypothetical protein GY754_19115 [bacterium]|nr:hypothetical protein [bacterium]
MNKVRTYLIFALFAAIISISGCEAGLSSNDSNQSGEDSKFSFSEMYEKFSELKQDNISMRNEIAALSGNIDTTLTDEINLLKAEVAALKEIVPIGAIIAWDKNLTGVPSLPENFMECNGSVISDTDSPLNGQTLPNLNGDRLFLRGSSVSGTEEDDQVAEHHHDFSLAYLGSHKVFDVHGAVNSWGWQSNMPDSNAKSTSGVEGGTLKGAETRPKNMSVVWIMRIK